MSRKRAEKTLGGVKRSEFLSITVTPEEKQQVEQAAINADCPTSTFGRRAIFKEIALSMVGKK